MGIIRVGIIAVQHESNTFLAGKTRWEDFQGDVVAEGERVRDRFSGAHHEVAGFFDGLDARGAAGVGLFAARATPGGTIEAATASRLLRQVERAAADARGLDGLLVAPHGAAVSEIAADFDGHWLSTVRDIVGPEMPVVCTLDLHANVSARMIHSCQATIAYHTNPHIDQHARGIEAARLLCSSLQRQSPLTQTAAILPLAVGIERQNTSEEPCRELFAQAARCEQQAGILAASPVLGFPYADVHEMGSSLIVVTDDHRSLARRACRELAEQWWNERDNFVSHGRSVEDSVASACLREGPVGLLDMGDNVGGGSPGDGTLIAREVLRRGGPPTLVCLWDPVAAQQAVDSGVGCRIEQWTVGGRNDDLHGAPLSVDGVVTHVTDGKFHEPKVRHGGKQDYDMGPTAVVACNAGLTVIVHSQRTPPFSAGQVTSTGLDPKRFQIIVLKGVQAPVAAYQEICRSFLRVDTPGVTSANLNQLAYEHRRRPLYPLETTAELNTGDFVDGC